MVQGSITEHNEDPAQEQRGSGYDAVQATPRMSRQADGIGDYIITYCDSCVNERVCKFVLKSGTTYTLCISCTN